MRSESLAEMLGTCVVASRDDAAPVDTFDGMTGQEFARAVLSSQEFRSYIKNQLTLGDLPAAVITRLMDYAWGKPTDKIEIKDTTDMSALSDEQLEQRAAHLLSLIRGRGEDTVAH